MYTYSGSFPPSNFINARTSDIINITDFGVDRTGVASSSTAIQAAIDSATTRGCILYIPKGTYLISTPLTVNAALVIMGSGWGSILKAANNLNDYVIKVTATSTGWPVAFRDFAIDCNGTNQTAGGGIHAAGTADALYDHLYITKMYASGILVTTLLGGGTSRGTKISGCRFDTSNSVAGDGIGVHNQTSSTITDRCVFVGCGGSGSEPFSYRDTGGFSSVTNCIFANTSGGGVRIKDTSRVRVLSCSFSNIGLSSITVTGNQVSISQCYFDGIGNGKTANTASGIHLSFGTGRSSIVNNTIMSHSTTALSRSGIRETSDGGNDRNIIANNQVYVATGSSWATAAVEAGGSSPNSIWVDNITT